MKDLLFHVIDVEDGWTNGDLRGQPMIQASIPELWTAGPDFSSVPLAMLRDSGRRARRRI